MQVNDASYQIKDLIEKAKNPLVIVGENADVDQASLAVAWMEVFESYHKKPLLVTKTALPNAVKDIVNPGKVKTEIAPKKLIATLDWVKNKLDRVSYDLEGDKFNLIISSKGKKIDPSEISFSYRGEDYDLVIILAVKKEEDLYKIGVDADTYLGLPSVLFARSSENEFAKVNLVNEKTDSLSSYAAKIFEEAKITLPTRAADALLYGMRTITSNFTDVNDPMTFEAAAFCKRSMIPGMIVPQEKEEKKEIKTTENNEKSSENWMSPKVFRTGRVS